MQATSVCQSVVWFSDDSLISATKIHNMSPKIGKWSQMCCQVPGINITMSDFVEM